MNEKIMLIVDDIELNRTLLKKIFINEYKIIEAKDGFEAMEILNQEENINIVLLDIVMPRMDGLQVLRKMSEDPRMSQIPVVVATSEDTVEMEQTMLNLGATEILHRPFSAGIARKRISNIFSSNNMYSKQNADTIEAKRRNMILDQTKTFVVEYDCKTQSFSISPSASKYIKGDLSQIDPKTMTGFAGIVYRPDIPALREFLNMEGVQETIYRSMNVRLYSVSNVYEWFRFSLACYFEYGEKQNLVIIINNAHKEVEALRKLEFLAESDQLTRIPNMDTFIDQTRAMIDGDNNTDYAIIRMDIERFRTINQLYGTDEADNILKYIGVKLQECMETENGGTYCRVGSDVFAICTANKDKNISNIIDYISQSIKRYPIKFDIRMSFGIYLIDDKTISINTMVDRAFSAQKTVKGNYLNNVAYYDDKLKVKDENEQAIILDMHKALEENQFKVYLQPKCRMDTGKIIGAEALARWEHPEKGIISPAEFIPIFEKNGFVTELDHYILISTCKLIKKWVDTGFPLIPVSVNVSRTDLYNPQLFRNILQVVEENNIPHDAIEFELTESSFVSDNIQLCNLTHDLQTNDFHVLMDDFGSGYSSLNSLKDIHVDVLKIDLKFLPTSMTDHRAGAILSAVVEMANKLKLEVVAEGVETLEQVEFLKSIGCNIAQGFYYYKPMPIVRFEEEVIANGKN